MADPSALLHPKIVLINPLPQMRTLLRNQLYMFAEPQVLEAGTCPEGLTLIREHRPDLVITTLQTEPCDGISFTHILRRSADSPHPYMPIILILPASAQNRIAEARNAGVNAILLSPVSVRTLQNHVEEIICNPRPFIRTKTYFGPDRRLRPRTATATAPLRAAQI